MRLFKLFLIFFIAMALDQSRAIAFPRSEDEMRRIAAEWFQSRGNYVKGQNYSITLQEVERQPEFSIYESDGRGFVIIRADEGSHPILAYSTKPYQTEDVPDGLKWWLTTMKQALSTEQADTEARKYVPVDNLLQTQWGQESPYNLLCPGINGKHYPTGCVATALAQLLYYYRHPAQGHGQGRYTTGPGQAPIYQEIKGAYLYDNMLPIYKGATPTEEQSQSVAVLMRDLGYASFMEYGTNGSGAMSNFAAQGLIKNMDYDSLSLHSYFRDWFDTKEWMDMVSNELRQSRPIYYAGADETSGGHAFVISGIDENGLVYVNWGWDGKADGYYDIATLVPMSNGRPLGQSYKKSQSMITGFKAVDETSPKAEYRSHIVLNEAGFAASSAIKNFLTLKTSVGVTNLSFLSFYGTIGFLLHRLDDSSTSDKYVECYNTETSKPIYSYNGTKSFSKSLSISNMPEGVYRITFVCKPIQTDEYQAVRSLGGITYIDMTKNSKGELSFTDSQLFDGICQPKTGTIEGKASVTKVYDTQGHLVHSIPTVSFNDSNIPPHGIFIVKQGNKVWKVAH